MYRSRVILGCILALVAACSDSSTAPIPNGPVIPTASGALNIVGVVERPQDYPALYALRQSDRLVFLVYGDVDFLEAVRGQEVVATGAFRDDGMFLVEKIEKLAAKPGDLDVANIATNHRRPF